MNMKMIDDHPYFIEKICKAREEGFKSGVDTQKQRVAEAIEKLKKGRENIGIWWEMEDGYPDALDDLKEELGIVDKKEVKR